MQLPKIFFEKLEVAVWILDHQHQVLDKTQVAEKIEANYQIDLSTIIAISQGEVSPFDDIALQCMSCPIHDMIFAQGFPLVLKDNDGALIDFWGQVTIEADLIYIQIKEKLYINSLNKNRLLLEYLNEVREKEQKRIALDLHDSIAQSVYSLMLEVRSLKWLSGQQQTYKIQEIDQHFSLALQEIKDLARQLRPISIDEVGLISALKQFIVRHEEMTGFDIQLEVVGKEPILADQFRIAIYRVIQEATTNAVKYSGTNTCYVYIHFNDKDMSVIIEDHGVGFDVNLEKNGFGLYNMQERIYALKGTINISSIQQKGTTIMIKVPYQIEGGKYEFINSR